MLSYTLWRLKWRGKEKMRKETGREREMRITTATTSCTRREEKSLLCLSQKNTLPLAAREIDTATFCFSSFSVRTPRFTSRFWQIYFMFTHSDPPVELSQCSAAAEAPKLWFNACTCRRTLFSLLLLLLFQCNNLLFLLKTSYFRRGRIWISVHSSSLPYFDQRTSRPTSYDMAGKTCFDLTGVLP